MILGQMIFFKRKIKKTPYVMLFISNFVFDIYNIKTKEMKVLKIVLSVVIVHLLVKGLVYFDKHSNYFANYANDTLLALIIYGAILFFVVFIYSIRKNKRLGFQADDELSSLRKYKVGYNAYFLNLLLWFFIFNQKSQFSDISNLLGGGIILSLVIGVVSMLASRFDSYEK
jgi:hypothetical protein